MMRWQSVFLWFSCSIVILLLESCPGRALPRVPDNVREELSNVHTNNLEDLRSINDPERLNEDETQISALPGAKSPNAIAGGSLNQDGYVREARAAVYNVHRAQEDQLKHFDRIPAAKSMRVKHGTSPPPDESDEDDFETLEANREAFLEILNEHSKHPHRRRSLKRHSNKFQLKYDFDKKRYSITEQQSDEF